MINYAGYL